METMEWYEWEGTYLYTIWEQEDFTHMNRCKILLAPK
jgi:hypothetical protein